MLERQRTLTSTSNGPQDLQTHTEKPREKLSAYAQTKKQKIALSVRPEKNPWHLDASAFIWTDFDSFLASVSQLLLNYTIHQKSVFKKGTKHVQTLFACKLSNLKLCFSISSLILTTKSSFSLSGVFALGFPEITCYFYTGGGSVTCLLGSSVGCA